MNRAVVAIVMASVGVAAAAEERRAPREKPRAPVQESRKVKFPGYDPTTGELLWELEADKVTREPDSPRLHGTNVRIVVYNQGMTHVATAREGSVDTENNAADLSGDVVIVFGDEGSTRVETDSLTWRSKDGTARTADPVRVIRRDAVLEGVGAKLWLNDNRRSGAASDRTNHLVIEKTVKTTILPSARNSFLGPSAPAPGGPQEPIVITCAGPLTFYRAELTAVYRNNVRVTQGPRSLTCDVLTLSFRRVSAAGGGAGSKEKVALESVTATGNVRLDDTRAIALGDALLWSRREAVVRLIGRPAEVRWDNGNRLRAGLIERSEDGSRLVCGATPDSPGSVYLLALADEQAFGLSLGPDPALLTPADIPKARVLAARLVAGGAASAPSPASRIWDLLTPEARTLASQVAASPDPPPSLARAVVEALNERVLSQPGFYSEVHFRGVELPARARELLAAQKQGLSPHESVLLNRLLLEAAFPQLVRKGKGR